MLAQGAVVLMITDGLDRDAGAGLAARDGPAAPGPAASLIWLNPLLRYEAFEPRSMGMKAMLPYVDEFRPVHNLESLDALAVALSRSAVAHAPKPAAAPRHAGV